MAGDDGGFATNPRSLAFTGEHVAVVVEFMVEGYCARGEDVVRDDDLIHLLERISTDEQRPRADEIKLFLHLTQCALFRRFAALQKPGDQSVECVKCLRPCAIGTLGERRSTARTEMELGYGRRLLFAAPIRLVGRYSTQRYTCECT